ncbi:MAG: hypothetical protein ACRDWY_15255 [Actinomycetes bacterium]
MANPFEFFLNSDPDREKAAIVEAPAFSITKVMAAVAPLVTIVVAAVTAGIQRNKDTFDSGQIIMLIIALLAFLAITGAADVISRGIAAASDKQAAGRLRMVQFDTPLKAKRATGSEGHEDVRVVAASDASPPEFLYLGEDEKLRWSPADQIRFKK